MFCLELILQPLSELLVRQVGKSNVQWFTYPFLPPTTFSGLLYSILVDEVEDGWRKNYVEVNDDALRQLSDRFPDAIPVGAYPLQTAWLRGSWHYRQHLGRDKFNYESFAFAGNKKLAIAESLWTPYLRGFVLSHSSETLERIRDDPRLLFRVIRVGKKGIIKVAQARLIQLTLEQYEGFVSTIVPLEMLMRLPEQIEIFHVPVRLDPATTLRWHIHPCLFGCEARGWCYKGDTDIAIPKRLLDLVSTVERQAG